MITEADVQHHFVDRFVETHGEPRDGYVAGLWKRLPRDVTIDALEGAAEKMIRTKRSKTFPAFAECLDAIQSWSRTTATAFPGASKNVVTAENYVSMAQNSMKLRQRGEGIGCMIEPGSEEWFAWKAYFAGLGYKASRMHQIEDKARGYDRETDRIKWYVTERYMVPSQWPVEFDPNANQPQRAA